MITIQDVKNAGVLTTAEMKYILTSVAKMQEDEADQVLAEADPNNTGKVDYMEFVERLMAVIEQS